MRSETAPGGSSPQQLNSAARAQLVEEIVGKLQELSLQELVEVELYIRDNLTHGQTPHCSKTAA